jgi:hypothetical protein
MLEPHETLARICDRLAAGAAAADVIAELRPWSLPEALAWARLRPLLDEYRGRFPDRALGVAAVLGRRAVREFRLEAGDDGRVRPARPEGQPWRTPEPAVFTLDVAGGPVRVEYVAGYFPAGGTDHFSFVSPDAPGTPHSLSGSGYWSHFCPAEAVEACGGPQAYAALYAGTRLAGAEKGFTALFEGEWPEARHPRRKRAPRPGETPAMVEAPPVVGGHTAAVAEERRQASGEAQPPVQKTLF